MGNKASKVNTKPPVSVPAKHKILGPFMSKSEWMNQIQMEKTKYEQKNNINLDYLSDYQLLIQYLSSPQLLTGYSVICIIARMIRLYVDTLYGYTIIKYNENNIQLNGIKISIAIHPITGQIYIADAFKVYKLQSNKKKLETIAVISDKEKNRITDLTFNPNGSALFCLLNGNLKNIYFIDYKNENKSLNERINTEYIFDKVNICIYDFNNLYLNSWRERYSHSSVSFRTTILPDTSLYTFDPYQQNLWILNNTPKTILHRLSLDSYIGSALEKIDLNKLLDLEMLFKKYVIQMESKQKLDEVLNGRSLDDVWNDYIIAAQMHRNIYILAFDVDKYYGAIYIITSNYMFFRIEKVNKVKCKWKITHSASLRDVLTDGLPFGVYTIKYDSVTGRIIALVILICFLNIYQM